nr:hypothetical protein [Tanacetum cinerariifolium]
ALRRQPDRRAVPAAGSGPAPSPFCRLDADHDSVVRRLHPVDSQGLRLGRSQSAAADCLPAGDLPSVLLSPEPVAGTAVLAAVSGRQCL